MTVEDPAATNAEAAQLRMLFEACSGHAGKPTDAWYVNPMVVWARLYEGCRDCRAGVETLGFIQRQQDEIDRLQAEVDRLTARDACPRPEKIEVR